MAKPIQSLPGEIWKPVVGYEGLYEVSNMGRVKRLAGTPRCPVDRLLRPQPDKKGYLVVYFSRNACVKRMFVHHVVLYAFSPDDRGRRVGCHNNGVNTDNRACNLRWDTQRGNMADRVRHGTLRTRVDAPNARLSEPAVREIRQRYIRRSYAVSNAKQLALEYGVSWGLILAVVRRAAWGHVD